jgi:GH15 family glucan-1,4-alpha-glucosidase
MNRYPNISDHGLIGDLQTAALVSSDGTIDFFCCPRFDSPSVFASLLDADKGGYFRIAPDRDDYVSRQLYFPDTAMLITRFMTPDGVGEVLDFMPIIEGGPTDRHRLVRHLRVARGTMRFVMEIQPRFDYGRAVHTVEVHRRGRAVPHHGRDGADPALDRGAAHRCGGRGCHRAHWRWSARYVHDAGG